MERGGINSGLRGCGSDIAIPFFLSYQVIAGWLILNLVIAAIIDGLSNATADREQLVTKEVIEHYLEWW